LTIRQHEIIWHGKDDNGRSVSSGLYFYKLQATEQSIVKRMVLMK